MPRLTQIDALVDRGDQFANRRKALLQSQRPALLSHRLGPWQGRLARWRSAFVVIAWWMQWGTRRQLRRLALSPLPDNAKLSEVLDDAAWVHSQRESLQQPVPDLGLGPWWQGAETDWAAARPVLAWARQSERLQVSMCGPIPRQMLTLCTVATTQEPPLRDPIAALPAYREALSRLDDLLALTPPLADPQVCQSGKILAIIDIWQVSSPQLRPWCALMPLREQLLPLSLTPLWHSLETRAIKAEQLRDVLARSLREQWWERRLATEPRLRQFRCYSHQRQIAEFRNLDKQSLALARQEVVARVAQRAPEAMAPGNEMGLVMRQLKLRRSHLPIRQLFTRFPTTLRRLKPCVLMSPLSVAHYLDPSLDAFDVVVFDEASPIPPWEAVGAIARGQQVIVMGDSKQLPPTSIFSTAATRATRCRWTKNRWSIPKASWANWWPRGCGNCCSSGIIAVNTSP